MKTIPHRQDVSAAARPIKGTPDDGPYSGFEIPDELGQFGNLSTN